MFPTRKFLPHDVPAWVPENSRYFITINCAERGGNHLCSEGRAEALLASIPVYENLGKWFVFVMVVMPDHVHLIATFSKTHGIRKTISTWKSFQSRTLKIDWQFNYFEHRLRNENEFTEKLYYVLMNPVRKGLAATWQDWPHTFVRGNW
jgi:putative transposase